MFETMLSAYRWFFLQLSAILGTGWGIVALSLVTSALMTPLMRAVAGIVRREKEYEDVIQPQIDAIRRDYATDRERTLHIQRLYARYAYSPLCAVKKVLPLFVQIPFLLLTYYMLKGTAEINGVSFLFLKDLGQPDALLTLASTRVNLLPLVMTAVNVLTVFATPGFTRRDWAQAIGISLLFLVLLYTAPAALLLYWTLNNVISLFKVLLPNRFAGMRLLASRAHCILNWRNLHVLVKDDCVMVLSGLTLLLIAFYFSILSLKALEMPSGRGSVVYVAQHTMTFVVLLAAGTLSSVLWRAYKGWGRSVSIICAILPSALFALFFVWLQLWLLPRNQARYTAYMCSFDFTVVCWVLILFALFPFAWFAVLRRQIVGMSLFAVVRNDWPLLLLPICAAVHYGFSSDDFSTDAFSLLLLIVYLTMAPFVFALASVVLFRRWVTPSAIYRLVFGAIVGLYVLPMISTESGFFDYKANLFVRLFVMAMAAAVSFWAARRKTLSVFVVLLLIVTAGRSAYLKLSPPPRESEHLSRVASVHDVASILGVDHCVRSNNVFLLIFDSYEHAIVLRALGYDNSKTEAFLRESGFVSYQAYGPGRGTVENMMATFTLAGFAGENERTTIAGDNLFSDFLRLSGYRTSYVLNGYMLPRHGERMPGDYYYPEPQAITRADLVLYPSIMRGMMSQAAQSFNGYTHDEWVAAKRRLFAEAGRHSNFIYAHSSLPQHVDWYPRYRLSDHEEQGKYFKRLDEANRELVEDVRLLLARQDDAIIIVASDHGGFLLTPEVYDKPDARNILDHQGILLSVRWPRDYRPRLKPDSVHGALLESLICLTEQPALSRFKSDNPVQTLCFPVCIDEGLIKQGVYQFGPLKGMDIFTAAEKTFQEKRHD